MSLFATTVVVVVCVFGGALLGMALRAFLPEGHSSSESEELVRLGLGLVATTVALVPGLANQLGQIRWLMFEQKPSAIPTPLLVIPVA